MTLTPYAPAMFDEFALRLLDVASGVRKMAQSGREYGIQDFALHDKKANEWLKNLEHWAQKSVAEMEMRVIETRAARRASAAD
jgi:hypothetical protein